MRRTTPLKKMDMAHPQEEEEEKKIKKVEKEEGLTEKNKEKVKL
jgi:hypothetical protein